MRRSVFPVILLAAAAVIIGQYFYPRQSVAQEPGRFTSRQHLAEYVRENIQLAHGYGVFLTGRASADMMVMNAVSGAPAAVKEMKNEKSAASRVQDSPGDAYSATNVQVEGVDEADIIKNDGKYMYIASANQLHILEAYPAEQARLLSTVKIKGYISGLFLNGSRIVVISDRSGAPGMMAAVYDITDRASPSLVRTLAWEGGYVSSRMIGDCIYLVLNMPVVLNGGDKGEGDNINLPVFNDNDRTRVIQPEEIQYFDHPDYSYLYTMIVSINIKDDRQEALCKTFLTGASQNVYSSPENLYLTGPKAPDMLFIGNRLIEGLASLVNGDTADQIRNIPASSDRPDEKVQRAYQILENYISGLDYAGAGILEEKIRQMQEKYNRDVARERNKTVIYKFSVKDGSVDYRCRGEVNGRLLNQFSMDEEGGCFRVATTSEGWLFTDRPATRNNIYVMDEKLDVVGKLEGLAPGERIFSARFMGGRVYLVTFRRIDPLFVIDLKNPVSPKVLGELKIPGYSDYLHPYDENHIIGIGKEVPVQPDPLPMPMPLPGETSVPGRMPVIAPPVPVREQGVKIALFDVSNPSKPVEVSKYVVDKIHSDSEVSRNHKAFLFSKNRNLMALPVSYPENWPVKDKALFMPRYRQWQGMYVFNISPSEGISLKGRIEHPSKKDITGYWVNDAVKRAAYINEVFYTISEGAVKMSGIEDLKEIKTIGLPENGSKL
ncbi:MAG: hypothetical protein VR68_03175 [Peptococcaceae bacterium BRH_c4a]|nr:MAG: hypothetical protein VR68_03175 [Peptococcaceae bacterium BRH_c4a]